jgi:predicted transcriptional regulator
MRNRSRADIIAQILEAAKNGASLTRIMYHSFTSYAQSRTYLKLLIESGLLLYDKRNNSYKTSKKGVRFLRAYNELSEFDIAQEYIA